MPTDSASVVVEKLRFEKAICALQEQISEVRRSIVTSALDPNVLSGAISAKVNKLALLEGRLSGFQAVQETLLCTT